jgi:hypothetical protein
MSEEGAEENCKCNGSCLSPFDCKYLAKSLIGSVV